MSPCGCTTPARRSPPSATRSRRSTRTARTTRTTRPRRCPNAGAGTTDQTFARLFDALNEGVYVGLIAPSGAAATIAANPHLRLIFGWDADTEASAVQPFAAERFIDQAAHTEFIKHLTQDGQVQSYMLRLRRVDGSGMWVEVTARADRQPGRKGYRVEAVIRDVTERKTLQDQSRDVYHQLLQAEKLAALGQTMSGVAHELNNPLATILACAERLASLELESSTRRDLDAIHNAAERAARIVRNLQTFARKRHTTRATVELNQVVRDTLALRAHEQRAAHIRIVNALAAGLPPIFADPHQIQQILLNLIMNAEQAMLAAHGRGTLVLRSWQDPDRDAVVLEVNDDGPGVPVDTQSKIFDPFFTTKAVGKGTGLGLTVAYAIAQEHGGRLRVASDGQRGASFFLELPVGGTTVRVPETLRVPAPPSVPSGARALVVEDERALGEAVAATLTDEGFRVDRAENGEEALARVRGQHYDVIICDLKMPKLDGMAFFAEVSKTMPKIARRLVFVTGDVAGSDAERFLEESGCRWIAKPFRLRDLVRVARETLQAT